MSYCMSASKFHGLEKKAVRQDVKGASSGNRLTLPSRMEKALQAIAENDTGPEADPHGLDGLGNVVDQVGTLLETGTTPHEQR
jgi:hypothetical protein